ncbi:MAG: potassium channel protein [Rhodocyclaceae bacterium]|nr:potassium channel protein [Rhodocyclaceae bacterium]
MAVPFRRSTRRLFMLLGAVPLIIVLLGSLYMVGMATLENNPRDFWSSIEWASETLTTTGYGSDAHWHHPLMNLLVIFTQVFGMFLYVLFFPFYVLPYLEEQFEARLPRKLPPMDGRVLIQRYSPAVDTLVGELGREGIPLVILEQDDVLARTLRDRGYDVVAGNLEEQANLLAGVERARALVTNADDHLGATFILIAREFGFRGPILALCADPLHRAPMEKIGATAVFTPSHVLAAALAARASTRINPRHEGLRLLGGHVDVAEFRVREDSPLAGRRLGDLRMREQHGVTIIGQWSAGQFRLVEGPDTRVGAGAILVAVGPGDSLRRIEDLATPVNREGPIVVAGYGAVGHKVVQMLEDAGESTVVIDPAPQPGVGVVGNVLEQSTLDQAGVKTAKAVVLALSNDSAGVFAAAVVRDYAGHVPLIARVNRAPNVARLYEAGADFALSIGQVAGQILAGQLLDRDDLILEEQLRFIRVGPGGLAGAHPWKAQVRERTGAAVVAVERGERVVVNFEPGFRVEAGDVVFVCGSARSLDRYREEFRPAAPPRPAGS